jgi:hypothetical protein
MLYNTATQLKIKKKHAISLEESTSAESFQSLYHLTQLALEETNALFVQSLYRLSWFFQPKS